MAKGKPEYKIIEKKTVFSYPRLVHLFVSMKITPQSVEPNLTRALGPFSSVAKRVATTQPSTNRYG